MKKLLQKTKSFFLEEIIEAKNNDYDAIFLPINQEEEPVFIVDGSDIESYYDIPISNEWEAFIIIDFMRDKEKFIDLYDVAA